MNQLTSMGDSFGKQLVGKKLSEGFTVVHYSETNADDFTLGILPLGQKPFHPYQVRGADRITYENERIEVHQNQRDFVGPIKVEGEGRSLYVTAAARRRPCDRRDAHAQGRGRRIAAALLRVSAERPACRSPDRGRCGPAGRGMEASDSGPPGMYYVVFDNTPTAGTVNPPVSALDDRAAVVNYLIQIGDGS